MRLDYVRELPCCCCRPPPAELLNPLLEAADALGLLVQYSHQGFLPNKRQQRMAGLAAIEFGQALMKLVSGGPAACCLLLAVPNSSGCAA